jgi:hypothetical protein
MNIETNKLQECDVVFVRRKDNSKFLAKIMHKLICWATKSPYFHVAYVVNVDDGIVFEANGFRKAGYAKLLDYDEYDVKRLDFPLEDRQAILQKIISTNGCSYDYGEIISLFARKKLGINLFYDDTSEFICSEELFSAVKSVKNIQILDQSTGDISPADLWESKFLVDVK